MKPIKSHDAKTRFSKLIAAAECRYSIRIPSIGCLLLKRKSKICGL